MSYNLPDPTGCSFFTRPKKRHIAVKVAKKIVGTKAATIAAAAAVPVLIVEQVAVHILAVSYVAPSYSTIPDYTSHKTEGVVMWKDKDPTVQYREGAAWITLPRDCSGISESR